MTNTTLTRNIALLGATGSIGDSTLDVIARHPTRFTLVAAAANKNAEKLAEIARQFRPQAVALRDEHAAKELANLLKREGIKTRVLSGEEGVANIGAWEGADTVVAAITGAAGLLPTVAAAQAGKRIVLANKEALVMGGEWFMKIAREHRATLLPIDSEHNAIFQCLPPSDTAGVVGEMPKGVKKIILTASGGPFLRWDLARLARVTPDEAVAHPVWKMGRKISVDSATMMNKGLEVIEARHLFGVPLDRIEVAIHPQSVVHSMVEYEDGSVLAQLGTPDMRTPITQALAYPERIDAGVTPLTIEKMANLTFASPDLARFPCLNLAFRALREAEEDGGGASIILNAANECAVAAFLEGALKFTEIAQVIEETMGALSAPAPQNLEEILWLDGLAREIAQEEMLRLDGDNPW